MNRSLICVLLLIAMLLSFTACSGKKNGGNNTENSQPAFTSYSIKGKIEENDKKDTTFLISATEKSEVYELKITGENVKQELSISADRTSFLAKKTITLDDINFDGFKDIIVTFYSGSSSGKRPSLNVYLYSNSDNKYLKTDAEFCNYKLYKDAGVFTSCETEYSFIGTDTVYKFDGMKLETLRNATFQLNDNKKMYVRIIDYSDGGSFLMYKQEFDGTGKDALKDFNTELFLLTGLDGNTVSEKSAEDSVYKIVGSSNIEVDCEGFVYKNNVLYYLMRVDRSDLTSAYYYVNTVSGEVSVKQNGSQLI